jgi:hypothetical protein
MEFTDIFYDLEDQQLLMPMPSATDKKTTYAGCKCDLNFQILYFHIVSIDPLSNLRTPQLKKFQPDQSL